MYEWFIGLLGALLLAGSIALRLARLRPPTPSHDRGGERRRGEDAREPPRRLDDLRDPPDYREEARDSLEDGRSDADMGADVEWLERRARRKRRGE